MKSFFKVFATVFLFFYSFASFCAWDLCTIVSWTECGRAAFLGAILVFSFIITASFEDELNKK